MRRRPAARLLMILLATCGALVPALAGAPAARASTGSPPFLPGAPYTGEFAGPSIVVQGRTYWAFGTNTGGDQLPLMSSTDLRTWTPRKAYPDVAPYDTWPGYFRRYNDAMPTGYAARWAAATSRGSGRVHVPSWQPSAARVGSRWVVAYAAAAPSRTDSDRHCISIATSRHLQGPYRDESTGPVECSGDPAGSIDPQVFVAPGDVAYLVWKNAGVTGSKPTQIFSRRLSAAGTGFARGAKAHFLLQTAALKWEGNVIESPAMIRYAGRYYLFFSANDYLTARYATGYAICAGPSGPCRQRARGPLLATNSVVAGPGEASPFVDTSGHLRLAYSAWTPGHVGYPASDSCQHTASGCNQRRLHIATLAVRPNGLLTLTALDA